VAAPGGVNDRQDSLTGFEPVYVELDWYDGPRAGLASVDGVPHNFRAARDYCTGEESDDEPLDLQLAEHVLGELSN
jgi:hypothetical protein